MLITSYVILISTMRNLVKNGGELLELHSSERAIKTMVRGNSKRPSTLRYCAGFYETRVMSVLVHIRFVPSEALSLWQRTN